MLIAFALVFVIMYWDFGKYWDAGAFCFGVFVHTVVGLAVGGPDWRCRWWIGCASAGSEVLAMNQRCPRWIGGAIDLDVPTPDLRYNWRI
jgi:hypothetical protein